MSGDILAAATAAPVAYQCIGGNVAGYQYWDRPRLTVNLLRQGYRFTALADTSRPAHLDEFGNATEDFSTTLHWLVTYGQQLRCAGRATGYCEAADITLDNAKVSVADWAYKEGKNELTFTL